MNQPPHTAPLGFVQRGFGVQTKIHKKMEKLSGYELYEAMCMYQQLIQVAKGYSHIDAHNKELARLQKKYHQLAREYDRREEELLTK